MSGEIRLVAPFSGDSGYGHFGRTVLSTLLHAGLKVEAQEADYVIKGSGYRDGTITGRRVFPKPPKHIPDFQAEELRQAKRTKVSPYAPTLLCLIPENLEGWHEYSSGPRIGWTMCESDRLNQRWARAMHGVDLLLAPSRYVLETFRRDAPSVPSELCHLPVDPRIWTPEIGDVEVSRRNLPGFLFFSVFTMRPRKHWAMLMQAFAEEFAEDDAALIVRPSDPLAMGDLAQRLNAIPKQRRPFVIVLDKKGMADHDLADYYRACDCYALPSAEGFGLPFVEAALCGTPSVALNRGGAADVVDGEVGYPVPSTLEHCYGNLPNIYPSDHKFPTPRYHDLRYTLRRAYEDRSIKVKGALARQRALERFTPEAIAPRLLECIEQAKEVHKGRTRMYFGPVVENMFRERPVVPGWGVMLGDGYGDAFAALGNCQEVLKQSGGSQIGILHYGWNKGVGDFLRIQPCIREVVRIEPPDKETFQEIANEAGGRYARPIDSWLPHILSGTGIPSQDVAHTQIHWPWGTWPVHRPSGVVLSDEAEQWATAKRAELGEFILVQPYSLNSVGYEDHWPHWVPFLSWLLRTCENSHLLVFGGVDPLPGLKHWPNVVDLIGQTPTMMHLLALCDRAKGVVTTCNALANWTAIRGIPGLVAGNTAIPFKTSYWRRFMETPPNTFLPFEATFSAMQKAAVKWLEARSK